MQINQKTASTLKPLLYFFIFLISYSAAQADNTQTSSILQQTASRLELWKDREWLNLLHYATDSSSASGYTSHVDDKSFFNSQNAKYDPKAELLATLSAFYRTDLHNDKHPQCRFVARLAWLKQKLNIDISKLPKTSCKEYHQWRNIVPDQRVTLVFPAYHLNSPSSMFGHTLLRLDPAKGEMQSDWLSMAVNFGANIREDDNSILYAFKGLSGGYPGYFIVTPYFKKIKEYNSRENRDMWEYPLNLTAEETRRMVTHLWELKDVEFDYYFFDENCSYRLLELLEVARPSVELTDIFGLTAIPVDTVRAIENANMIEDIHYRPSQATVLRNLLEDIPAHNIHFIKPLSRNAQLVNKPSFQSLSQNEQKQIIEAAYKYLRYIKTGKGRDMVTARNSHQLLTALNRFPVELKKPLSIPSSSPEKGHYSKRAFIGFGQENNINFTELSFRFAFHKLEDNEKGFLRGAQINMGNFQLRYNADKTFRLQQFDLIDIFSLTARNQFFDALSWKVYTGFEQQFTNGKQRLTAHVTAGMGLAYDLFKDNLSYTMLTARLEKNPGFEKNIEPAWGFSAGSLFHFASGTAHFEISGEEFSNGSFRQRLQYKHNLVLSRNHALQLTASREKQKGYSFSEISLSYHYFFF